MADMMTVILRIDGSTGLTLPAQAAALFTLLSDLISMHLRLGAAALVMRAVWHTGCAKNGCEGLRVLGTWIKPGRGLGITEIGRTGISSPHNIYRRGYQANPQQKTLEL